MKVSYVSDLHLEHWFSYGDPVLENYTDSFSNKENSDVLILAGDILIAEAVIRFPFNDNNNFTDSKYEYLSRRFQEFMTYVNSKYEKIMYVMGNHEYYGAKYHKVYNALNNSFNAISNGDIYILDNATEVYGGVAFIGSTLWTDMARGSPLQMMHAKSYMNDYHTITYKPHNSYRKLDPLDTIKFHNKAKEFITQQVAFFNSTKKFKVVVVTHHAPSWQSVNERFRLSDLNGAYVSDLDSIILDFENVDYWIHGHLHDSVNYTIGKTNIISNPVGYPREKVNSLNSVVLKTFEV